MSDEIQGVMTEFKVNNEMVGLLMAMKKAFSTGSRGFHGTGKVMIGGKPYQVNVQLVEVGSKPNADGKKTTKKG